MELGNILRRGILALKSSNASIINASLGEAGTVLPASWNSIFGYRTIASRKQDTVYVIAAGNEALTQTADIEWSAAKGTHFLLVGSVDPAGAISSFSNRPGEACLLDHGVCGEGGKLMNRFITAPGELILVSDGMGGTVRRSGTSFAAPLVSGAIALLHDRWPWLAKDPAASVEIILRSARDAGAPGVDPVYGVGLLDITASQSPLDFNKLTFYRVRNGIATRIPAARLRAKGVRAAWEANGVYFALFEKVGKSYRDFLVPMSSQLSGRVMSAFGSRSAATDGISRPASRSEIVKVRGPSGERPTQDATRPISSHVPSTRSPSPTSSTRWARSGDRAPLPRLERYCRPAERRNTDQTCIKQQ